MSSLGPHHIDEDEVLTTDERERLIKILGGERITEVDQHDKKRPPGEALSQRDHELLKIGRDGLGFEGVEGVADEIIVILPIAGADEPVFFVREANESEEVALPLGDGSENERTVQKLFELGGDEIVSAGRIGTIEPVALGRFLHPHPDLAGAETGVIDDDVDFLRPFDLVGPRDGSLPTCGRFPVDVDVVVAGLVVPELLKVASFTDLPDDMISLLTPHQE